MKNSALRFPPSLALALAILAASTSSLFVRFAQEGAASLTIAALRLTFASVLLSPWLLTRYRGELRNYTGRRMALSLAAGFLLALHFATWISSLEFTSVASSVVLVQTSPLFVAILSALLIGERVSPPVVLGLAIALTGSALVGISDACEGLRCPPLRQWAAGQALKGDFLALLGGITGAGYIVIGRKVRSQASLISYIGVVYGSAALFLLALMAMAGQSPLGLPLPIYGWILLLALFPQLIAHSTYNWALRYLPATVVAVSLLGEPIAAAILARLLLAEVPSALRVLGGVFTLAGIALVSVKAQAGRSP